MAKQNETRTTVTTAEKAPKAKRLTRGQAANQVVAGIAGKTTLDELAKRADQLFAAGGGKSKLDAARFDVRRVLDTAEAMGVVKLTRPTDILVELAH